MFMLIRSLVSPVPIAQRSPRNGLGESRPSPITRHLQATLTATPGCVRGIACSGCCLSKTRKDWRRALKARDGGVLASKGFRLFWTWISRKKRTSRPASSPEIRALIRRILAANLIWGAPRIHGELLRASRSRSPPSLGRFRRSRSPPLRPGKPFSTTTSTSLVSIDFFTVPTASFRVLFALVVLAHRRRLAVHFNVIELPTAAWTAQQILEAFPEHTAPPYLVRERDQIYGKCFRHRLKDMGIAEVLTAPQSPWQNPFANRLIGSIRRKCLDHVIVLGEKLCEGFCAATSIVTKRRVRTCRWARTLPPSAPCNPGVRKHCGDSTSRWPAPSVRVACGVTDTLECSVSSAADAYLVSQRPKLAEREFLYLDRSQGGKRNLN